MATGAQVSPIFQQRRAGLLLHPTSLPSGTLGKDARRLVDFMAEAGLSVWQMLPIGPTHGDGSPYQGLSAHAGNPQLIDPEWLIERNWVSAAEAEGQSTQALLELAAERFFSTGQGGRETDVFEREYQQFCKAQAHWLDDYARFQTLREIYDYRPWNLWPDVYRQHNPKSLVTLEETHGHRLNYSRFEQFVFYSQWKNLRSYAHQKGIFLFGDVPIFVAHDSADVWANQKYFRLDEQGNPLTVAGVPPDYFSETGQHWGNPHYDWQVMEAEGFSWWVQRMNTQLALFDLLRIDHFRGFEAFWEIPGQSKDARLGQWVKAPGRELLSRFFEQFHELPLVAENLGLITEEVEALRKEFKLPGMLVLQFGFDGNPHNPHLPHCHMPLDVIYTGTHDNDTSLGWYKSLDESARQSVAEYLGKPQEFIPWPLIRSALASVGKMAVIPMQDFLALDSEHRMNMPGTVVNNWIWRFDWSMLPAGLASRVRRLLEIYGRIS